MNADLALVVEGMRQHLPVPAAAVKVEQGNPGESNVVSVALRWALEDVGDAENGPRLSVDVQRWIEIVPPDAEGTRSEYTTHWMVRVFDYTKASGDDYGPDNDPGDWHTMPVPQAQFLLDLDGGGADVVAEAVAGVVTSLGVEVGEVG